MQRKLIHILSCFIPKSKWRKQFRRYFKKSTPTILYNNGYSDSPATPTVKTETLKEYAKKYACAHFVETGTYLGDTVEAMKLMGFFKSIQSIELSVDLYNKAKEKFSQYSEIVIHQGDSGKIIGNIIPDDGQSVLFWLDGHYSGGITAQGDVNTPIENELKIIANKKVNCVIIIDDARCFGIEKDYPPIDQLNVLVDQLFPNASFKVENDMVRIVPN